MDRTIGKMKRLALEGKDLVPNFKFKSSPSPRSQKPPSGLIFFISKMGLIVSTSRDCCEDLTNQYIHYFPTTPSRTRQSRSTGMTLASNAGGSVRIALNSYSWVSPAGSTANIPACEKIIPEIIN